MGESLQRCWEPVGHRLGPAMWCWTRDLTHRGSETPDLVNEPLQNLPPPKGVADYLGAQVRAARAIRPADRECSTSRRAPIIIADLVE